MAGVRALERDVVDIASEIACMSILHLAAVYTMAWE